MWSILRPGANDIRHAILGMPGSVSMGDAQAAEVNEVIWAVPLVHGAFFELECTRTRGCFSRTALTPAICVRVRVREKQMP